MRATSCILALGLVMLGASVAILRADEPELQDVHVNDLADLNAWVAANPDARRVRITNENRFILDDAHALNDNGFAAQIVKLRHIEELELYSFTTPTLASTLAALSELPALRTLRLIHSDALAEDGMQGLDRLTRVTTLQLHGEMVSRATIERVARMPALAALALHVYGIPDAYLAALERCPSLVKFEGWAIGPAGLHALGRLPLVDLTIGLAIDVDERDLTRLKTLRRLSLWAGNLREAQLLSVLTALSGLERLSLAPGFRSPETLARVLATPALRSIALMTTEDGGVPGIEKASALEDLDIGGVGRATIAHIAKSPCLAHLALRGDFSDADLAPLRALTQLELLSLSSSKVDGSGLAALEGLPRLASVRLDDCTTLNDVALSALSRLPALRSLLIRFTDRRVPPPHLARLPEMPGLAELDLYGTDLEDPGLASLARMPNLASLSITRGPVTGAFLATLECRALTKVSFTDLRSLDPKAMRVLARLPGLREVTMRTDNRKDCGLPMVEIRAANPSCKVNFDYAIPRRYSRARGDRSLEVVLTTDFAEIVDAGGEKRPLTPTGAFRHVRCCDISPDLRYVATLGEDWTCRVFEVATAREVANLRQGAAPDLSRQLRFIGDELVVCNGTGRVFRVRLADLGSDLSCEEASREALWETMGEPDSARAHAARARLMSQPGVLPWLETRLAPVAPVANAEVEAMVARLDSPKFEERDEAQTALLALGAQVAPVLRAHLAGTPEPELGARLTAVLARIATSEIADPETRRAVRAIGALVGGSDPAARALLERLAGGMAGSAVTDHARYALDAARRTP